MATGKSLGLGGLALEGQSARGKGPAASRDASAKGVDIEDMHACIVLSVLVRWRCAGLAFSDKT